ncbi:short chain dehydrogenase [Mesorhizobium sp. M1E.F.Ca.ET.045.02.1.1]|uniref:short chain dehydrogenase n=1 Tax=unclassified Mesorhizobium TaxID=325217 RepID=UPI000F761F5D|nr:MULTISPECIES: short chain dehydrogenase [unclassified Mesorhizobium]AZO21584.1 short chain dehydrogenase [Mesorhizobium sp. M1E.F.Ca.ET.045.02.1.1]RUW85522.1 short chain dehydrogenase [Mesorhizobium sp. M1E.F.Ca.ET.063.01.1.1]
MRIVLVGATGVIGSAVASELGNKHDVVPGARNAELSVDIASVESIDRFFDKVGPFDALVCTAGAVRYAPLEQLSNEQFEVGLRSKLMGQVNLVLRGLRQIRDNGSFTLTSGLTNEDPILQGASAALVNGGLEGFVRSAAIELRRGLRINIVSPSLVAESASAYGEFFPGTMTLPARDVALGYAKSVEGAQTGRIYRMGWSRDQY